MRGDERMKRWRVAIVLVMSLALLSSCAGLEGSATENNVNYEQIKKMVTDIMQTEDGKKAIQSSVDHDAIKQYLLLGSEDVKQYIESTLLSAKGLTSLQKITEDPKFSTMLAKSMQKENEKIQKDLMKDPEYQKMLIDVMKDPEFEKNMLDLMKSSAYREHMMTVMKESLQSPLFQAELLKLLTKVQEEASKPKKKEDDKKDKGDSK